MKILPPSFSTAAFWMVVTSLANKGVTFLGQLLLTYIFAPEAFGTIAPILGIGNTIGCLGGAGIRTWLVTQKEVSPEMESSAHRIAMSMGLLVVCLELCIGVGFVLIHQGAAPLLMLFVMHCIYPLIDSTMMVQQSRLHREMKFKISGGIMAMGAAAGTLAIVISAYAGLGLCSLMIGWPINALLQKILIARWAGRAPSTGVWRWDIAKAAMILQAGSATGTLVASLPIIFGGLLVDGELLGKYQWAASVSTQVVYLVSINLQPVYMADFSRQIKEGNWMPTWRNSIKRSFVIGLLLAASQALILPLIVERILSSKWQGIGEMFIWSSLAAGLIPVVSVVRSALNSMHASRDLVFFDVIVLVFGVPFLGCMLSVFPADYPALVLTYALVCGLMLIYMANRKINAWCREGVA